MPVKADGASNRIGRVSSDSASWKVPEKGLPAPIPPSKESGVPEKYPEAARLTALDGAQIIFYPTAIGTLPSEDEGELKKFQTAWQTVQRGHGVANGSFIAAVNRIGTEGEGERSVKFWGHSFVSNPYGEVIAQASDDREEILFADVDFSQTREFRRTWPFFRDRRIDSYERILRRFSSE